MSRALSSVALVLAACGGRTPAPVAKPVLVPHLQPPGPGDPHARGAAYLGALAQQIEPRWATFLEDCRVRLPASHPLNAPNLVATIELGISLDGKLVERHPIAASGNGDYETAISDVLADASPLPVPPRALASDDDLVHIRWQFARDRRQAGPATASIVTRVLPVAEVVARLLERGDVTTAARRADATVAESVMIAALREALAGTNGAVRLAAVEAIGRANVLALGGEIRALLAPTAEEELRVAAAIAAGRLGDEAAVAPLLAALDLAHRPRFALAGIAALVELGHASEAAKRVALALPDPTALAALAVVQVPEARANLAGWFARGDARTRAAVCAGRPDQAIVRRGLADADATVRAMCVDAATVRSQLTNLANDRDQVVRAHAVAAMARLDPAHSLSWVVHDSAAIVRVAAVGAATPAELAVLAEDRDADVRAAAAVRLGPGAVVKGAADPAPAVRLAVVEAADDATLARLARDDSPAVASAATIAVARRAGRAAATPHLLDQLAASPPGSAERVRIALAWLLAR